MNQLFLRCVLVAALSGCASTSGGMTADSGLPTAEPSPVAAAPAVEEASTDLAFYTTAQASRGERLFGENCVWCHTKEEFTGSGFQARWRGQAVADVFDYVSFNMPDDNPGGLPRQTYADVLAYLLQLNGLPAGEVSLDAGSSAMGEMPLWPSASGGSDR